MALETNIFPPTKAGVGGAVRYYRAARPCLSRCHSDSFIPLVFSVTDPFRMMVLQPSSKPNAMVKDPIDGEATSR